MIDYTPFYDVIERTPLKSWLELLPSKVGDAFGRSRHGDCIKWHGVLKELPGLGPAPLQIRDGSVSFGEPGDCDFATRERIEHLLRGLHPWRKGPYTLYGVHIDTEWRSDWKWDRLCDHIQPLAGRLVLDVGCGNGYHCWRMAEGGAGLVVGIDPYLLYVMQFQAIRHFTDMDNLNVLPLGVEALPQNLRVFDTVFSMGVLSHRRSPLDHLMELRSCLRPGGELVLETLVIEGGPGQVLLPEGRYAKMRNVWFIPSSLTLESWLKRCGFTHVRLVDTNQTSTAEQHSTDWMTFESLPDFLDPETPRLTVEGLPAPSRAIFLALSP